LAEAESLVLSNSIPSSIFVIGVLSEFLPQLSKRMTSSLDLLFGRLANLLPPMLAEDELTQDVSRSALITGLQDVTPAAQAEVVLAVVERLFCALALMHQGSADKGQWRFNSYSAWLMARSLLETLANDHHTLFDLGYWSQTPADTELEEQRILISRMENGRVAYHPASSARPIRFVYVAWAVIRLGDHFLLYAREDKVRPDARGDFGLPGGRFKLSDVPIAERPANAEYDFAYGISHWPMTHLHRSLYREMQEELQLSERDHYSLGPAIDIAPYRRIEGARNHHSYTEYRMRLFPLQLNTHGAVKLLDRLDRNPELFSRFTASELGAERNARGQRAFVTALIEHFGPELKELSALPQAIAQSYLQNTAHVGVDIPLTTEGPIRIGRSGKTLKDHSPRLTEVELRWLWALAWHAKSLPLADVGSAGLLPLGWVRVNEISVVMSLRQKLNASGLELVEIVGGRYARLSINPRMVYFDSEFFRYHLHGNAIKGNLELFSVEMDTPLGILRHESVFVELAATLAGELRHIDGVELLTNNTQGSEHLRRMLDAAIGDATKNMGIRQLIAHVDKARQYRKMLIKKRN